MSASSVPLRRQLLRRKPVVPGGAAHLPPPDGAGPHPGAGPELKRTITGFQLACIGIGSTIGTGIFFVMTLAVPEAGPAVILSFVLAGIAAGLSVICYAELASAVPVSGSTYSYAYATLGELPAMGVAACLLLEYGVATAAVAVGWSEYLNKLLDGLGLPALPHALSAAPWDASPGVVNLPALVLVALCALLLIRGTSESARANAIMVAVKLVVLTLFIAIAFTAFDSGNLTPFAPLGVSGVFVASGTIFFSFIGLDLISTAGEEVRDPQRTLPRALLGALAVVVVFYVLVALAAVGAQRMNAFRGQEAGLAAILQHVTGSTWPSLLLSAGAVISIFSVTLVTLYGQTRILFTMSRDGMIPARFARVNPRTVTPVQNTVIAAAVVGLMAGLVPLDKLADMVSIGTLVAFIVVSVGVILLRVREPGLPRGFRVPGYPVTPLLAIAACVAVMTGLHWYTFAFFGAWVAVVFVFYFAWSRHHSALQAGPGPGTVGGTGRENGADR